MSLLKKTHTSTNHKFTYPEAVMKVNHVRAEPKPLNGFRSIQLEMSVFADRPAYNEGGQPIDTIYETVQVPEGQFQDFVTNLFTALTETEKYSNGTII